MFCTKCGKPVSGNSMFCTNCGAAVNPKSSGPTAAHDEKFAPPCKVTANASLESEVPAQDNAGVMSGLGKSEVIESGSELERALDKFILRLKTDKLFSFVVGVIMAVAFIFCANTLFSNDPVDNIKSLKIGDSEYTWGDCIKDSFTNVKWTVTDGNNKYTKIVKFSGYYNRNDIEADIKSTFLYKESKTGKRFTVKATKLLADGEYEAEPMVSWNLLMQAYVLEQEMKN